MSLYKRLSKNKIFYTSKTMHTRYQLFLFGIGGIVIGSSALLLVIIHVLGYESLKQGAIRYLAFDFQKKEEQQDRRSNEPTQRELANIRYEFSRMFAEEYPSPAELRYHASEKKVSQQTSGRASPIQSIDTPKADSRQARISKKNRHKTKRGNLVKTANRDTSRVYILQTGVFQERRQAQRQQMILKKVGAKPKLHELTVRDITWFSVWVGPFTSLPKARNAQNILSGVSIESLLSEHYR